MKHVIIGTAGHVDHGKTSLIQALTGTNTDRLKEEQERGMTIDIGFASLKLPDGTIAGIVDVPGHERFLKNMLAGATGVDVALIVVAADEGIMPQTREHLDILKLLQVENGVVALTKCDMVDKEWLQIVEADVRTALTGTALAQAPIIFVSSVTRRGIEALKKALMSAVSRCKARSADLPYRLPIDRVFSRPGFGTVVTGTLVAGTMRSGDAVTILPAGIESRIRGLQIHNEKVSEAQAGCRVAINLAGIEVDQLTRGAQLAAKGAAESTICFDGVIATVGSEDNTLKQRMRVRLHIGTAEIIGRISLLNEAPEAESGESVYIQFVGEEPFTAARGDRFILRTYSPSHTIAGGTVLVPVATKHDKADSTVIPKLQALEAGSDSDKICTALMAAEFGLTKRELCSTLGITEQQLTDASNNIAEFGIYTNADRYISNVMRDLLIGRVAGALQHYHDRFPLRAGMPREELRTSLLKGADMRTYNSVLQLLVSTKTLKNEGSVVCLPDFKVTLNDRQLALMQRIAEFYAECGIASPEITDVARLIRAPADAVTALLKLGSETGVFVCLADGIYLSGTVLTETQKLLTDFCQQHGSITVGEFRDLMNSNRKFSMQVLEYLDSIKFTRRAEDRRTIAK